MKSANDIAGGRERVCGATPEEEKEWVGWRKVEEGGQVKGADASEQRADRGQLTRKTVDTSHVMPTHDKGNILM